jgi:hypothetical protein
VPAGIQTGVLSRKGTIIAKAIFSATSFCRLLLKAMLDSWWHHSKKEIHSGLFFAFPLFIRVGNNVDKFS